MRNGGAVLACVLAIASCQGTTAPEAISLDGRKLYAPRVSEPELTKKVQQLEEARRAHELAPDDVESIVWLGRRLAYLGRFRSAIAVYDEGLRKHPGNLLLLRHRGHRWITVREFDRAIQDLELAAKATSTAPDLVEPDGQPNARNIPIGSLHSNIWYHLAKYATNPDRICSVRYWLFLAMARQGRLEEARRELLAADIRDDWDLLENQNYHQLLRMYLGRRTAADLLFEVKDRAGADGASILYGVASWYVCHDEFGKARDVLEQIVAQTPWPAFGHIAAEVDLQQLKSTP
jgi:tetratricopeptide (TPR) repeat protein